MTQEDIIRMAREAGVEDSNEYDHLVCTEVELERFAQLVAAAERDRMAHKWVNGNQTLILPVPTRTKENEFIISYYTPQQMEKAILQEREACAVECEDGASTPEELLCAKLIRARGQQ
jgi:hypothetical protein